MGTQLARRGVETSLPLWSAGALLTHPEVVADIHRAYAQAGAVVHTTNTFRTQPRHTARWRELVGVAVRQARGAVPAGQRVAGSIAPLEDCYHPERAPADPGPEHALLARALAEEGVDLLLCETFAAPREAWAAVQAAVATGVETWASFTAGYRSDLMTPQELEAAARGAVERGAAAVLVNCVAAGDTLRFVERLADLGVPFGAYANAGPHTDGLGWDAQHAEAPEAYADLAQRWVDLGATLLGSCCGTGPEHIRALAQRFGG